VKKIVLLFVVFISFQLFADKPRFTTTSFFDKTDSKSFGIIEGTRKLTHSNYAEQAEANNNLYTAVVMKKAGKALIGIGAGFTFLGTVLCSLDGGALAVVGLPFIIPGPIALVAGAVLLPLGINKEKKAKVELENLSVTPTKGGLFTTVGFRF